MRCVIVSAGEIKNYQNIKNFLKADDFFIFCDGGLRHAKFLEIKPNLIIGDFDSCTSDDLEFYSRECETVKLPREKDDTDTMFAVKAGLQKGFDDFLFLGAMGFRFDHALANVSALLYLFEKEKNAFILDDYSVMQAVGNKKVFIEDSYSYFSVLTPFGNVGGVCIENAKFPLKDSDLTSDFQSLGVSNEVQKGKIASVKVSRGTALLVKVF